MHTCRAGAFYFWPIPNTPSTGPWYSAVPIGKNTLCRMVKGVFAKAGLKIRTNHSLHAISGTTLIKANVSEEEIQERTDHCSVDAWR